MFHHHVGFLRAYGQIHRAADSRNGVRRTGMPVSQIAVHCHLKCAEHANVEVTATHHRERIGMVKVRATGEQGHRLLAGIDEIPIFFALGRCRPHAENAVLAVQKHFAIFRQVVGHQRRQTDAQIDIRAFGNVTRHAGRHFVPRATFETLFHDSVHAASLPGAAVRATLTTRVTKMPGETMFSGSSAPNSTVSNTCAIEHLAALAMIGPKLRAALR